MSPSLLAKSAPSLFDRQQHRLNYTTEKPFFERNSYEIYMCRRGTISAPPRNPQEESLQNGHGLFERWIVS
jgi:hypothetical protein